MYPDRLAFLDHKVWEWLGQRWPWRDASKAFSVRAAGQGWVDACGDQAVKCCEQGLRAWWATTEGLRLC